MDSTEARTSTQRFRPSGQASARWFTITLSHLSYWWEWIGLQRRLLILIQGTLIVALVIAQIWITHQFENQTIASAQDKAREVADGTINGLNTMMLTPQAHLQAINNKVARMLFIKKMGDSVKIQEMRVIRSKQLDTEFPQGLPQEYPIDEIDRRVLETGKPEFKLNFSFGEVSSVRTIIPFIALRDFRSTNCLRCHSVSEGAVLGAASVTIDVSEELANIRHIGTMIWIAQAVLQIVLYFLLSLIVGRLCKQLGGEPAYVIDIIAQIAKGNLTQNIVTLGDDSTSLLAAVKVMQGERRKAEEDLQLSATVFTHAREGIMITDADGLIRDVNETFTQITGYTRQEVIRKNPRMLSSGRHDPSFYAAMWKDLILNSHWSGEVWNRHKGGSEYAAMQTISAVRDAHGVTQHYVALFSDVTAIKEHQDRLEYIAHHDVLTHLPNRVLLADRMRQAMAHALRRRRPLAVIFLDLDGFKEINDKHGHDVGDQVLISVAENIKKALRDGDSLARIGGDEFVAVLQDLTNSEASVPTLLRLLSAAAQPMRIDDLTVQVSASLGITFYPQAQEVDADQLLRQADQAMYQAKTAGKNRYHAFDAELDQRVRSRSESLERIGQALHKNEFVLYYQPKVNMRTGAVVGAEALIRWQHPQKGLLLPGVFLPDIEDHHLAIELGEWVIDSALTQLQDWNAMGLNFPVSVNIGARQLQQPDFVYRLSQLLAEHPSIRASQLQVEILETSALEDTSLASKVIEGCRDLGVTCTLDDFGTGYSSLTYLKRLPVAQLKIDQSFVRNMLWDPGDLAILEGVIGLATAFRLEVIAEGVESVESGTMLLQLGCELAQGYGIARPMPANELPGWAAAWRPDTIWFGLRSINRDDVPLLFAYVEYRAWIKDIERHLNADNEAPTLDHQPCRLGAWVDGKGRELFGDYDTFQAVARIHHKMNVLGAELTALKITGACQQALTRISELYALSDELLVHMNLFLRAHLEYKTP